MLWLVQGGYNSRGAFQAQQHPFLQAADLRIRQDNSLQYLSRKSNWCLRIFFKKNNRAVSIESQTIRMGRNQKEHLVWPSATYRNTNYILYKR